MNCDSQFVCSCDLKGNFSIKQEPTTKIATSFKLKPYKTYKTKYFVKNTTV